MSSALAKQKKRLRRKKAMTDEQANGIVSALRKNAEEKRRAIIDLKEEISSEAFEYLRKKYTPDIQGEMMLYFLAYLRCEMGFGHDRLKRVLHGFNAFADIMRRDRVQSQDVLKMLMEECNFDVVKEFGLCEKESKIVEAGLNRDVAI